MKEETGISGVWLAVVVALLVPLVLAVLMAKKKIKQRGVHVTEMGEEGDLIIRNRRFETLVQVPWEGATSIPVLFEQASKKYANSRFLGSRRVISREVTTSGDGRTFEKLHLGKYEWQTYREVFDRSCDFSSGLAKFGHDGNSPAAIFADTQAEWLIAFQVVFAAFIPCMLISLNQKFWKVIDAFYVYLEENSFLNVGILVFFSCIKSQNLVLCSIYFVKNITCSHNRYLCYLFFCIL